MEKDASEIAKLTERILKDPKSKLFVPLAEEYKKIGQIDMAISVLNEGLKNNPGYATARSFLGRLLLDQGNIEGAQKELEEVVKAIPDNLLAQKKLGDISILLGKTGDALARYKTALSLNSSDKELASLVADMEAGKDVSARIPRTKFPAIPSAVKQAEPALKKPAAPAEKSVQQAAGQPSRTPAETVSKPAAVLKPAQAAPATVVPAQSAMPPAETSETIEEITEIEILEQPPAKQQPPIPSAVGPAETLPPLKSAEVEQPGEGAFDLSESVSGAPSMPESQTAVSWEPAGTEAEKGEVQPQAGKAEDDINTDTLAELYTAQGFYDKAIEIYQRMLTERPDNVALQKKLMQLHALAAGPASESFSQPPRGAAVAPQVEVAGAQVPLERESVPSAVEKKAGKPAVSEGIRAEVPVEEALETQQAVRETGETLRPVTGVPAGKAAASPAEVRRKETIDRLESWLKNIIKEKPE